MLNFIQLVYIKTPTGLFAVAENGSWRKSDKMPKIAYIDKKMQKKSLIKIAQANEIIDDYASQGYTMTLRQLYYQFVAKDLIPNNMKEYKKLGAIINDGRMAGLVDWDAIEDRTRSVYGYYGNKSPSEAIRHASYRYRYSKYKDQDTRIEVWIEKEALAGIVQQVASRWQLEYFACKGYPSQSSMHKAAERHVRREREGIKTIVLHMGDHDPSGIDMTRDIEDRLALFGANTEVRRIALNMNQIKQFNPPPNPAKLTDSRASDYISDFGSSSWELDALTPEVLNNLVYQEVEQIYDMNKWEESKKLEQQHKQEFEEIVYRYDEIIDYLDIDYDDGDDY